MFLRQFRDLGDIDFFNNRTVTMDLPREYPLVGLHLELDGSLDIDATLTLRDESPINLVRAIEIVGDGVVIQSWTGEQLFAMNYFRRGANLPLDLSGTATADPDAFRVTWYLPFLSEGVLVPERTILDTTQYRTLHLRVTWGAAAGNEIISAGTVDVNTDTHITVLAEEIQATPAQMGAPFDIVIAKPITQNEAAAQTQARVRLPRTDRLRGILVRVSDSATGFVLSDTLLNNISVELRRGVTRVYQATYDIAQNLADFHHRLTEDFGPGAPNVAGSRIEGYVYIDFHRFGSQNYIDPRGSSEFDLVVNVDAGTRLDVTPIQIRDAVKR